jgi:hypothetical protein
MFSLLSPNCSNDPSRMTELDVLEKRKEKRKEKERKKERKKERRRALEILQLKKQRLL